MRVRLKAAEKYVDCGSSSYRLPPAVDIANVHGAEEKAVAAATALQSAFGTAIFRAAGISEVEPLQEAEGSPTIKIGGLSKAYAARAVPLKGSEEPG